MFNWFSFLTYAVITAVTPGPNNIMSMTNAGKKGFRKALPFNFGILVGFTVVMLVCTLFCSVLTTLIYQIKTPMLVVGSAYMLYLAYETFRSNVTIEEKDAKGGFVRGLLLQFVNPKIYVYCIMSMESYILPFYQGHTLALILFAVLLAVIGFIFTLVWSLFGSTFKKLFSEHAKVVNTILALLLVYCAISLFL